MTIQPQSAVIHWISVSRSHVITHHLVEQEVMKDTACNKYLYDREDTRRGRPNTTDSDGRERDASAAATRDGGGVGGGTAMVGPINSSSWQININNKIMMSRRIAAM
jgi:hypothetical protein